MSRRRTDRQRVSLWQNCPFCGQHAVPEITTRWVCELLGGHMADTMFLNLLVAIANRDDAAFGTSLLRYFDDLAQRKSYR
jgi:hypothetical protein